MSGTVILYAGVHMDRHLSERMEINLNIEVNYFLFFSDRLQMLPPEIATLISRHASDLEHYKSMCDVWGLLIDRYQAYRYYWDDLSTPYLACTYYLPMISWKSWNLFHRLDDKPSIMWNNNDQRREWRVFGNRHRENDRPAYITIFDKYWYYEGVQDRDNDQPAGISEAYGLKEWLVNGYLIKNEPF